MTAQNDQTALPQNDVSIHHVRRVYEELKRAGAVAFDMLLPETRYLPRVIQDKEHVCGAVYGRYGKSRGVLVATDERIIFLNKKVLLLQLNDIAYSVVSGVSRTWLGPIGTVTLRTSMGNYSLRTYNQKNAKNFVEYVSTQHLQDKEGYVSKT